MSASESAAVVAAVEVIVVVLAVVVALVTAKVVGMGMAMLLIDVVVGAATVSHHYGNAGASLLITACGLNLG